MDDRVRPGGGNRLPDGPAVEQVDRDGLRSLGSPAASLLLWARGSDPFVAALQKLGDEPGADRSGRT